MRGGGRRRAPILMALAGAAILLLNFPLLLIWDQARELFGLPMLPVVLFLIWAGLIVALALVSEAGPRSSRDGPLQDRSPDRNPDEDGA